MVDVLFSGERGRGSGRGGGPKSVILGLEITLTFLILLVNLNRKQDYGTLLKCSKSHNVLTLERYLKSWKLG